MAGRRLLLINPKHDASFWGFEHAMALLGGTYSNAPLALLTVAALTPDDWDIEIVDENIRAVDLDAPCDVVGITAMNVQAARAFELAAAFRRRGRIVVLGGPFPTLQPERCAPHADVLVVGEAENTWPQFCRDLQRGQVQRRYHETGSIDLALTPVPRYDLVSARDYASMPIQTSRGCPFTCEFCDIIVMQGRKVRTKPIDHVVRELEAIRRAGGRTVFFTDDNFIGKPLYARQVVDAVAQHRADTGFTPMLYTQASVNLADHSALLAAMVRAGFGRVFLGIETPRQASIREACKPQNLKGDLLARIHKIQSAGMVIWAGMIVGFDHDDESIFAEQSEFLQEAGIAVVMLGMLNAPPRTPLFDRLYQAGRIDEASDWTDNCAWTNIVPARMSRAELFRGYGELVTELYRPENYVSRLFANLSRMPKPQGPSGSPTGDDMRDLWRATRQFTFSPHADERRFFIPNVLKLLRTHPHQFVEGAIHLGMWRHFARYVPELRARLREGEVREQRRTERH